MLVTLAIATVAGTIVACKNPAPDADAAIGTPQESPVARGEYLVNTIGCDDCHTPKKMGDRGPEVDLDNRFAGHLASEPLPPLDSNMRNKGWLMFSMGLTAAVGPWGTSYAANISSDSTGIGNWTEAQFVTAMRKGKYKGLEEGRPLLPPMPWQNFAKLSDEDLSAMFQYLKSTKPIKNVVPAPVPPATL